MLARGLLRKRRGRAREALAKFQQARELFGRTPSPAPTGAVAAGALAAVHARLAVKLPTKVARCLLWRWWFWWQRVRGETGKDSKA